MSKQISAKELEEIVTKLLTADSGEVDSFEAFQGFMTDIAKVVCDYCGGEVQNPADRIDDEWYVGIHGNDSLPDAFGGIWREYDPEGELFDAKQESLCSDCGQAASTLVGCPDGAEVCQSCFDAGAH